MLLMTLTRSVRPALDLGSRWVPCTLACVSEVPGIPKTTVLGRCWLTLSQCGSEWTSRAGTQDWIHTQGLSES